MRERTEACLDLLDMADDLLSELSRMLELLNTPIIAVGLLHFVKTTILREDFLGEPVPFHWV